jgi:methylated-DNA-[protein]-cysteine S-methyltransferase
MNRFTTLIASPVGPLRIVVDATYRLEAIHFHGDRVRAYDAVESRPRCAHVVRQLDEYFRGDRSCFDCELVLDGTPFQCRVWRELISIPYGRTTSYGELARRIGRPRAMRAVGQANGANRIPIVIPCHRVIASGGGLGGFGVGLDIKRTLLEIEGALPIATAG